MQEMQEFLVNRHGMTQSGVTVAVRTAIIASD